MEEGELRVLETIFAQVEDPRIERTRQHRLRDIIIIAICGVICGADGWVGISAPTTVQMVSRKSEKSSSANMDH